MPRGPERATIETGAKLDPKTYNWYFVVIGAGRKVVHKNEPVYETADEARAARDWLTQTILR